MRLRLASLAAALGAALSLATPARAETEVDLELVLTADISYSMDIDELILQRDGYVAALTSPEVMRAVKMGVIGKIAVSYVEWAGAGQQSVLIDWTAIDGPESAEAFAARLAEAPPRRAYRTSISGALTFSAPLFDGNGFRGARRVIDVSGDGANNQGQVVTLARDAVLARGISINGLPLMLKTPNASTLDIPNLDDYYRQCVIGGPGAFVIPVNTPDAFRDAIRTKLVLEISGIEPPARFIPAQSGPSVSCTIGEVLWEQRYGGN